MKQAIFGSLRLVTAGTLGLFVVALVFVGFLAWRDHDRVEEIRLHLHRMEALQQTGLALEYAALVHDENDPEDFRRRLGILKREAARLEDLDRYLDPVTPRRLEQALGLLGESDAMRKDALGEALRILREITSNEAEIQSGLVEGMGRDTRVELRLAWALPVVLLLGALLVLSYSRRRILRPLAGLGTLVTRLAEGEFSAVPLAQVDPLLVPLFNNYNHMVTRLRELESEHRARAESLEHEVRTATHALLQQAHTLARADRLAATGAMAASVAHELRNPLAGIHLALSNLKRECQNGGQVERLDLVIAELNRLSRLLGEMLGSARHAPEPSKEVLPGALLRDLVRLARYQVPSNVGLELDADEAPACVLQEDQLRQAVLNLVLNAVQAIGDEAGTIRIAACRDDQALRIDVTDDGPGFPDEVLRRGARPFLSTRDQGTGLGLAIVQRFAAYQGGDVRIENLEPRGARVTLRVPCE